ncbi:MAG TPA: hypothetical protein VGG19_07900 [Tepidisphaeraceae bacterium]|jgi:hypothetical protein
MSVDLRSNSLFSRSSLVLLDDSLVKLEHGQTEDRVRKFMFEAIEAIITWRTIPWLNLIIVTTFLIGPALILILVVRGIIAEWIGGSLFVVAIPVLAWYLYCRQTTIRIVRFGKADDIKGIFRPGKVRGLMERMIAGIQAVQNKPVE